jgi:hypothetical protein
MPSRPTRSAAAKTSAPSPAVCSLNWIAPSPAVEQSAKHVPTLDQRRTTEILAVQVQEIERIEQQPVRLVFDGRSERGEIGDALLVLHDHFTVEVADRQLRCTAALTMRP